MPRTTSAFPPRFIPLPDRSGERASPRVGAMPRIQASDTNARRWCAVAVASLVIAGLLSLAVVVGRLPLLSRLIDDPPFFKRCLVVHVDLALVVWFYAFLAGLLSLSSRTPAGRLRTASHGLAVCGVAAMLGGALLRGASPILANYVPVIDHPLFGAGLAAFFVGVLLTLLHELVIRVPGHDGVFPADARVGLEAAAVLVVIAAATWVSARAGLPAGTDAYTRAEFLAWGPGHVLQAANASAMLAVWLWLLERATGTPVLSRRAGLGVFGALVLPQTVMPLLTIRGTLDALYHTGATQLMRWTIFPVVLVVLGFSVRHLVRHRLALRRCNSLQRAALTGFVASVALTLLGIGLGACIRSSTTLVPAHYHASLGAVTVSFMTAAFFVCDAIRPGTVVERVWRSARRQFALFGVGQSVFALGFAIGGACGLGRKAYAAEQHVRSAGEICGLIVMGIGGLVAVAGGLWFLFLILREMRRWRRPACAAPAPPVTEFHRSNP